MVVQALEVFCISLVIRTGAGAVTTEEAVSLDRET